MNAPIYLDHNSTTPILPEVVEAMVEVYRAGYANPASQHQLGQKARRLLEETRERIIALLGGRTTGMDADRLIFTSGGTEANNLAIRGLAGKPPGRIIISSIEHPSVRGPAEWLATQGFVVDRIRVDENGAIDQRHAVELISQATGPPLRLVSIMGANNETGVVQPLAWARKNCRDKVVFHSDVSQCVGKRLPEPEGIPLSPFTEADRQQVVQPDGFLIGIRTLAAHKFGGPVGIGALAIRHGVQFDPLHFGGFQQEGLRPGTESVALAVGMRRALELAIDCPVNSDFSPALFAMSWRAAFLASLRDRFEQRLRDELSDIQANGSYCVIPAGHVGESPVRRECDLSHRLANTSNIAFLGVDRQELLLALDMAGVCCSTGSACASGSSEPSPVLTSMGLAPEVISSSLRFSFGITNTLDEAEEAARRIIRVVNDLRARAKRRK